MIGAPYSLWHIHSTISWQCMCDHAPANYRCVCVFTCFILLMKLLTCRNPLSPHSVQINIYVYVCVHLNIKHTYIHTYMCLYKLELSVCFCTMVVFCIPFQYSNFSAVLQSKNSDFSSYNIAVLERQRVVCSRQVMKSIFWVIFRYAFQWTSVLYMKRFIII